MWIANAENNIYLTESSVKEDFNSCYLEQNQILESINKPYHKFQYNNEIRSHMIITSEVSGLSLNQNQDSKYTSAPVDSINKNIKQTSSEDTSSKPHIDEDKPSNYFIDKIMIEANNTEFVKFKFMTTPLFVDKYYNYNTKVMVAIHSDGTLGTYSINTGKLVDLFDLNQSIAEIKGYNITQKNIDWTTDVVEFQTESYGEYMRIIILTVHGNWFIFDLKVKRVKRQTSSDMAPEIVSESLNIILSYGFNVWNTIIDSNSTKYSEEINTLLQQGLTPVSISHYGESILGTFLIGDSKGFFSIVNKDQNRADNTSYSFTFLTRIYTNFNHLDLVTSQSFLTLFTSNDKFSFIRNIDGAISTAHWSVDNTEIIGAAFNKVDIGELFIATKSGKIYLFLALQKAWDMIANFTAEVSDISNIKGLHKIFLSNDDNTGELSIFSSTNLIIINGTIDLSNINHLKYKPNYPKVNLNDLNSKFKAHSLDLVEDQFEFGYNLLIRVPGTTNKVMLIDLINHNYQDIIEKSVELSSNEWHFLNHL